MRKTDTPKRKEAEPEDKSLELERKKDAWKKYESNIRRARTGYSELDLDDFSQ